MKIIVEGKEIELSTVNNANELLYMILRGAESYCIREAKAIKYDPGNKEALNDYDAAMKKFKGIEKDLKKSNLI